MSETWVNRKTIAAVFEGGNLEGKERLVEAAKEYYETKDGYTPDNGLQLNNLGEDDLYTALRLMPPEVEIDDLTVPGGRSPETGCAAVAANLVLGPDETPASWSGRGVSIGQVYDRVADVADGKGLLASIVVSLGDLCKKLRDPSCVGAIVSSAHENSYHAMGILPTGNIKEGENASFYVASGLPMGGVINGEDIVIPPPILQAGRNGLPALLGLPTINEPSIVISKPEEERDAMDWFFSVQARLSGKNSK